MMTGQSPPEGKWRIDFIDPLFAVAIHIGIVEGLMRTDWISNSDIPGWQYANWENARNVMLFSVGLWLLATSWVGYHTSIEVRPITGDARFFLDIVLLLLYIAILVQFKKSNMVGILLFCTFVVYCVWDYFKSLEYQAEYYTAFGMAVPCVLGYLFICLRWWLTNATPPRMVDSNGRSTSHLSGVITIAWTCYFAVLAILSFGSMRLFGLNEQCNSNVGGIGTAVFGALGLALYRTDKKNGGKVAYGWYSKITLLLFLIVAVGSQCVVR